MSNMIIYLIGVVVLVFILVVIVSYVRSKFGSTIFSPLIQQPYSENSIKKNYFLGLAFLESPLILAFISAISFFDLVCIEMPQIIFVPFIYLVFVGVSAGMTIYCNGMSMKYFFSVFGAHPEYEGSLFMQLLLFSSAIQAPFIVFIVSLFIHKNYFYCYLDLVNPYTIFFVFIHLFVLLFVQYGVMKSIQRIIKELSILYISFPANIKSIFVPLVMQIGFLQAPYIFSFVTFLLLLQVYTMIKVYSMIVFFFLAAFFSLIGFTIANQSGYIVATALQQSNHNILKNRSIMNLAILSQILIDARILYILIIILLSITQLS